MKNALVVAMLVLWYSALFPTCGSAADCDDLLASSSRLSPPHTVAPEDLIELRDFGPTDDGYPTDHFLGVSPDGTKVALQVRRANAAANTYCLGIIIVDLAKAGSATLVAVGGSYALNVIPSRGFAAFTPGGQPMLVQPKWSPDGKWIAYLRTDGGATQAWRASADGSISGQLSHANFNIEDVGWSGEGKALLIMGRPGLTAALQTIADEGQSGYRFDDRFTPLVGATPSPRGEIASVLFSIDVQTGKMEPSEDKGNPALPSGHSLVSDRVFSVDGPIWRFWAAPPASDNVAASLRLYAGTRGGKVVSCGADSCDHISGLWLASDQEAVVYARREGIGLGTTGVYRWRPGSDPRLVLRTDDVLTGCELVKQELICGRDGSTRPRRLVAIDLSTGRDRVLFDPNPGVANWKFGAVKRLYWKNNIGIATFGDLVLPPDHLSGQKHPLIIVQYGSRGFLRGGTGDEFPIQAFAARGYAVLSFQVPVSPGFLEGGKSWDEIGYKDRRNWANRWSVQSSLDGGIDASIQTGSVDDQSIGITGLSDGATTVQFALIHSARFKAAAIASCCSEASTVSFLVGPVIGQALQNAGYPSLMRPDPEFWRPASVHMNADKIRIPLLMQLPDIEYLGGLETYTALAESGAPVDLYVFPGETHVKWQPRHRLAAYRRSLQWFDFWLRGKEDADPVHAEQYAHWTALSRTRRQD